MEINQKWEFVDGSFDTESTEMICVGNSKYGEVSLCLKSNMHITFAKIKLYSRNLAVDADAVFEDACKFGDEIARRWNECETKN